MRRVALLWIAQTVSVLGSGLTGFAIAVWAYQQHGSATDVSLIAVCGIVPGLIAAPFTGAWIDQSNPRTHHYLLIASDLGAGLTAVIAAALLSVGHARVETLAPAVAAGSLLGSLRLPSYFALVRRLTPPGQLERVAGLLQLSDAGAELVGPAAGGLTFAALGLGGVLTIDVATFVFAVGGVLLATAGLRGVEGAPSSSPRSERVSLDLAGGWRHLASRPGMLALLGFTAGCNLPLGIATTLAAPLLLSHGDATTTGLALTIGGSGMVAGSLVVGVWGSPRRPIRFLLAIDVLVGAALAVAGAYPTLPVFLVSSFIAYGGVQLGGAVAQGFWLRSIEPAMQGRVLALRRMIPFSTLPLGYALAGPIADQIGVATAYLGAGMGYALVAVVALAHPAVRGLDAVEPAPLEEQAR
jgi:MFS transporter, DHA3 family, macrolide efflux protein